jgi:predicted transcriptional regulator
MQETKTDLRTSEAKWTPSLIEAGFTIVPNVFLQYQSKIFHLEPMDLNILIHLASFWWDAENLPHPSKKTIAYRMGVHPTTIRRRIAKMEKKGLISRKYKTKAANDYDFTDLIRRATPLAKNMIKKARERAEKLKSGEL